MLASWALAVGFRNQLSVEEEMLGKEYSSAAIVLECGRENGNRKHCERWKHALRTRLAPR